MRKVTIKNQNNEKTILVPEGSNLLSVLREHAYVVNATCGGSGRCKKCVVNVNGDPKLSCQTIITEDIVVEFADDRRASKQILMDSSATHYRIAIDIGTTTLAGYLIDLDNGKVVATNSLYNPQISYGADVISRIKHCSLGSLPALHRVIIKVINEMVTDLLPNQRPEHLILSGNTVMLHILMNEDPTSMGRSPYIAPFLSSKEFSGDLLKINAKKVILLPSISSFIGADIVAGCLYIGLLQEKKNVLFIDLGTNGEMVLKANDTYYGTSTAAGPAFEGANIEKGLGGVKGAISAVSYEKTLMIETISGTPEGICGSGLIDIIALLRREQMLDETGLLVTNQESQLVHRLIDDKFYVTDTVYITQKDIREFQLAKSAIVSGIMVLLDQAQIKLSSLAQVYIAGGFGFHMNKKSAIAVGLLPVQLEDKIRIVGNSSGLGSVQVANDLSLVGECETIAREVICIDLNKETKFNQYFIDNIYFAL